ncbi:MAG: hypothetical protein ACK4SY_10130, partial [Pyrobaculum sp.]
MLDYYNIFSFVHLYQLSERLMEGEDPTRCVLHQCPPFGMENYNVAVVANFQVEAGGKTYYLRPISITGPKAAEVKNKLLEALKDLGMAVVVKTALGYDLYVLSKEKIEPRVYELEDAKVELRRFHIAPPSTLCLKDGAVVNSGRDFGGVNKKSLEAICEELGGTLVQLRFTQTPPLEDVAVVDLRVLEEALEKAGWIPPCYDLTPQEVEAVMGVLKPHGVLAIKAFAHMAARWKVCKQHAIEIAKVVDGVIEDVEKIYATDPKRLFGYRVLERIVGEDGVKTIMSVLRWPPPPAITTVNE